MFAADDGRKGMSWGIARGALMAGFVAEEVDEEGRRLEGVVTLRANDDGIGAHLLLRPEGCRYVYRVVAREDGYMQRTGGIL